MNELYEFVFKSEAFLTELAMEDSSIVNVEFLALLEFECFFFHGHVRLGLCRIAFRTGS